MASKIPSEIAPYTPKPPHPVPSGSRASYTPSGGPSPTATAASYGKSRGKANAQTGNIPSVQTGNSYEVAALPAVPGTLRIGEDKNVSTPVSG